MANKGLLAGTRAAWGDLPPQRRKRFLIAAILAGAGAIVLTGGWIGVSGTRVISDQLAYIASGGFFGLCLVALSGALLVTDFLSEQEQALRELRDEVSYLRYEVNAGLRPLSEPVTEAAAPVDGLVHLPGSSKVHRSDCALVAGKQRAEVVTPHVAGELGLVPCRSCDPDVAAATNREDDVLVNN